MRADLEQIDLRRMQLIVGGRPPPRRARDSDEGAQLVDGAVRIDARVAFCHARAAEERRFTAVAGACVDLHASDSSWRILSFTTISAMSGMTSQAMFFTTSADNICTTRRA